MSESLEDIPLEELPPSLHRETISYVSMLKQLDGSIKSIEKSVVKEETEEDEETPDEKETEEDEETPDEKESDENEPEVRVDSIKIVYNYNGLDMGIIIPANEPFNVIESGYDVLADFIRFSNDEALGGDFNELGDEANPLKEENKIRQRLNPAQVLSLCASNRQISLPALEAQFGALEASSEYFEIRVTTVNREIVGALLHRFEYRNPDEMSLNEFYTLILSIYNTQSSIRRVLRSGYIQNQIVVPDGFQQITENNLKPDDMDETTRPADFRSFQ